MKDELLHQRRIAGDRIAGGRQRRHHRQPGHETGQDVHRVIARQLVAFADLRVEHDAEQEHEKAHQE